MCLRAINMDPLRGEAGRHPSLRDKRCVTLSPSASQASNQWPNSWYRPRMKRSPQFVLSLLALLDCYGQRRPARRTAKDPHEPELKERMSSALQPTDQFASDVSQTWISARLDQVRGDAQHYALPLRFRAELDSRGLKAIAGHFSLTVSRPNRRSRTGGKDSRIAVCWRCLDSA